MTDITAPRAGRREWIGLAVLMLPTLLLAIDLTVLHLAVPALSRDLAPTSSQLLWIVDIYGFLIAGSLITMGTLGDRIGRRRLLLFGAGAFGVASVLAAFATSAEMLIAARALLGVAGATLMPSTQSLIRTMFPDPGQRTAALGVWMSGFSAGAAIGPLLGGWMLERYWWGSVFLIGVPVMLLLLALGPFLLPEYRDPSPGRFDLLSAGQSLIAVLLVIYGVKRIAESGLGPLAGATIAAGLVMGALFLRRQRALADPLLDLGLFRHRAFSSALGTNTIAFFVQFGISLYVAQYLQLVLGLTPFEAGLWTLPSAIVFVIGSNVVPKVVRWVRPVTVITAGLVVTAIGFGLLTRVDQASSLAILMGAWIALSAGLSMVITLTVDMVLSSAPPERAGAAAALSETGIEFGGALGIAILGSLGTAVYRGAMVDGVPAGVPAGAAAAARDTLGAAVLASSEVPGALGVALVEAARGAFVQGLHLIAIVSAVLMVGLAILVLAFLPKTSVEVEPIPLPDADADESRVEVARAA